MFYNLDTHDECERLIKILIDEEQNHVKKYIKGPEIPLNVNQQLYQHEINMLKQELDRVNLEKAEFKKNWKKQIVNSKN